MQAKILRQLHQINHPNSSNFFLIAGPCAIEGKEMAFDIAGKVHRICLELEIPYIFKGSYKKANRTKLDSFTGIGDLKALEILRDIGRHFNVPTITDIHSQEEAALAAPFVDILQIPAFLCRQTDLLVAAAKTGKIVNIKKGQFMNSDAMRHAVTKIRASGNSDVMLTERGTSFGYQDLVVDYRSIPIMKSFDVDVILDCTHALQRPNQKKGVTDGQPAFIETIAMAGIATGVDGLFLETHPNPKIAKSDGANMLPLELLEPLLRKLLLMRNAFLMSQKL